MLVRDVAESGLEEALGFQRRMLLEVSRTFALTIPELPAALSVSVSNAYLLCRIADTIEDEPALDHASTTQLQNDFVEVLKGRGSAEAFAQHAAPLFSDASLPAERELIAKTPQVVTVTRSLPPDQQAVIVRCVEIMGRGMSDFQRGASPAGLADQDALDRYCYYVAGVVGEMLTELFCAFDPAIARHRAALLALAPSFGEGLQLTNILKDVNEDRRRGACWLPRAEFAEQGIRLDQCQDLSAHARFPTAMRHMVGLTRVHLEDALRFTLLIPSHQPGIRRFCLWAIGMAVLTLQRIHRRHGFQSGGEVKISRRAVRMVTRTTSAVAAHSVIVRALFAAAAAGLPRRRRPAGRPAISEWHEPASRSPGALRMPEAVSTLPEAETERL